MAAMLNADFRLASSVRGQRVTMAALAVLCWLGANLLVDDVLNRLILANIPVAALAFALLAGFHWPRATTAGAWASAVVGVAWGIGCFLVVGEAGGYTWPWAMYGLPLIFLRHRHCRVVAHRAACCGYRRENRRSVTRSAVQREYGALAAGYDARWSGYVRATTDMALARVPCAPNVRLLDVGCGTGALLDRALTMQPAMQCTGVDLTREMLQRAAMRLGGRASLVQGSGDALPVADACVDVVVSTSALHYMRDAVRVLREMRRFWFPAGRSC